MFLFFLFVQKTVPEAGGVGSAGGSTDSCLKTAYLSEDVTEAEEEPETGVSMAGALRRHKSYSQTSERVRFNSSLIRHKLPEMIEHLR